MPFINRGFLSRVIMVGFCLALISPIAAQDESEPAPPWSLTKHELGEPTWAPLLRVRDKEAEYRDTRWWSAYLQIRAMEEAFAGKHAAALAYIDASSGAVDSIATLAEGTRAVDALEYIEALADTAQIVMINERHHAGSDRLLTLELLGRLRAKGFRYFAAEALAHGDSTLYERGFPTRDTGYYTRELVFAEVIREAMRLGYVLIPYEATSEQRSAEDELTPQQRRDHAQAANIHESIFESDPEAKLFVHAGYSHILEEKSEHWYPMALYLREMTGIDAVTIDQTRLSERSDPSYEHPVYRAAAAAGWLENGPIILLDADGQPLLPAAFAVDLQVLTPRTEHESGRPRWMRMGERRARVSVELQECENRRCFIEARLDGEPSEALPYDWTEAENSSEVELFLPVGEQVDITVFDESGGTLRVIQREVQRR